MCYNGERNGRIFVRSRLCFTEQSNMAKDSQFVSQIADIETNFPQWYTDVVLKSKWVD